MNSSQSSYWRARLLILSGILLAAFNLRTAVTSLTPILDRLGLEFGFGAPLIGVFGMAPTAAFALMGVATPAIIRRTGLMPSAWLSMFLASLGLLLRFFAPDTWTLLAANILALAGMGMGNVVLPPLVKSYFPTRIGALSTAYITAIQLGTVMPALLAVPMAKALGNTTALGLWALPALAALALLSLILWRAIPPELSLSLRPAQSQALVLWRSPLAWGLVLMFGMTSLISYSLFTWLPLLMVEAGASPEFGGVLLGLFAALGLLSSLLMPWAGAKLRNPYPLVVLCLVAYALAIPGLIFAPMSHPVLWVALLGIGPSTFPLALTLVNLRTQSPSGSAALSGFAQGLGYLLSCLGPLLVGVLRQISSGWTWPLLFLALCALLMALGAWRVCKPGFLEDAR